jgi:hypothetical protein
MIAVVLWLNVIQVTVRTLQMGAPGYHFGLVSQEQYLEDNLGWYARAIEKITKFPEGDRVIFLWEPRGYYCLPRCESDEVLDRWVHEMRTGADPDLLSNRWVAEEFSHVLVYRAGADFIRQDDDRYAASEWAALDAFLETLILQEDFGETYELYRLLP